MKNCFILLPVVLLISYSSLYSQDRKHTIDSELDECIELNSHTHGTVECIEKAIEKWDAELNKYYKLLMNELDEESAKALKSAELEWISYKDKEMQSIEGIFSKLDGTMYIPMKYYSKMDIIKTRALQLKDYYGLVKVKGR
jgi:uncharacterized protein YecT (DUF1311 family)